MNDNARFKIDICHDRFWDYGVYEKANYFGFDLWTCIKKTDDLDVAKEFAREALKLPIFVNSEEDLK